MGKAPLYVRPLTDEEREALETAVRSSDAFVLRRAQILLASARGEPVGAIATTVGFSGQAVRQVIHSFHREGPAVPRRRPTTPHTVAYCFDTPAVERPREILHQHPRQYGKETSVWTLELAADVAYEQGLTAWRVSDETVRATLARMGVRWQRAKHWISSPDPEYARKKARRDRLIRLAARNDDLLLGFLDEVWW
ncbi:MAG TPA: helix-turn-helix domain-containing protein, partial [Chloroflexota bacterium]